MCILTQVNLTRQAGSDSEQESNDGAGSSRKPQKRARSKVKLTTSKASDDQFVSHSQTIASSYGCLSLLKNKRSEGILNKIIPSSWIEWLCVKYLPKPFFLEKICITYI